VAGAPFPPKDVALRATPSTGPQLLDRVRKDHTAPQTELANGQTSKRAIDSHTVLPSCLEAQSPRISS
jgi:hypothetical protein